jgi:pyruvate dehydrogenase (quinone)/pyruvate oxidase
MPGKVTYDQAKKFAGTFFRGQPRKATIATSCNAPSSLN